jgi:hypothetical protein
MIYFFKIIGVTATEIEAKKPWVMSLLKDHSTIKGIQRHHCFTFPKNQLPTMARCFGAFPFTIKVSQSELREPEVPPPSSSCSSPLPLKERIQCSTSNTQINQHPVMPELVPVCSGDFVVIKMIPEGKRKVQSVYFVACLLSEEADKTWNVRCMRRYRSTSLTQFIYPVQNDIGIYHENDFLVNLGTPSKVIRNVHHFDADMSAFVVGLR